VLSFADGIPSHHAPAGDLHELADLDALICEPELGVAENGAVWIASSSDRLRAALFLAERVVVVVHETDLVADLHAAYARIDVTAHPFGAFVAGPSKTADIEQSLVIGAHGPKALSIVVVRE
jgi:L-lactate dehydrogenase complex protein LldG